MLLDRVKNNNSLGPSLEDDKTYNNYLALARAICGIEVDGKTKFPSIGQCCSAYSLYDKEESKTNLDNIRKIRTDKPERRGTYTEKPLATVDIETEEVKVYENGRELAKAIGIATNTLSQTIKKEICYNKKYLICKCDDNPQLLLERWRKKTNKNKTKIAFNVNTKEQKSFKTNREIGKYINVSEAHCTYMIKNKITSRTGWQIFICEGESNGIIK